MGQEQVVALGPMVPVPFSAIEVQVTLYFVALFWAAVLSYHIVERLPQRQRRFLGICSMLVFGTFFCVLVHCLFNIVSS
jgi:hypothetical protein